MNDDSVRIPKKLLFWLWGFLMGATLATSISMVALDPHRFRWWVVGIVLPPCLSAVGWMIAAL